MATKKQPPRRTDEESAATESPVLVATADGDDDRVELDVAAPEEAVDETAAPQLTDDILTLPILPLRGTVVFPLTVVPLAAAQPRSLRLIDRSCRATARSAW